MFASVLALVYGIAVAQKVRDLGTLEAYMRRLAGRYGRGLAQAVVGAEALLFVVLLLAAANQGARQLAGWISSGFLFAASLVYSALLVTGQSSECNCFGSMAIRKGALNPAMRPALLAARNSVLVTLSVSVGGGDGRAAVMASGAVGILLSAGLTSSIIRERALLKRRPHPRVERLAPSVLRLKAHTWWVNGHPRAFWSSPSRGDLSSPPA